MARELLRVCDPRLRRALRAGAFVRLELPLGAGSALVAEMVFAAGAEAADAEAAPDAAEPAPDAADRDAADRDAAGAQAAARRPTQRPGALVAFHNVCPHQGTPLDAGLEDDPDAPTAEGLPLAPLTDDGRRLLCVRHGATFRLDDGACTEGPCPGTALPRLAARWDGETLVLEVAED